MRERTGWASGVGWGAGLALLLGMGCSGTTIQNGNPPTGGDAGTRTASGGAPRSGGTGGTGDARGTGGNAGDSCGPGEARSCTEGGCRGAQACQADGTWSACVCSESTGGVGSGGSPTGGAGIGGARTGGAPTGGAATGGGRTGGAPTGGVATGGFVAGGAGGFATGGAGGSGGGGTPPNTCEDCLLEHCSAEFDACMSNYYCVAEYVAIQQCLDQEYSDNGAYWPEVLDPCAAAAAVDIVIETETNALVSCTLGDGAESDCTTECFDFSSGTGGTGGNPCSAGTLCGGVCVDTRSDPSNCGTCSYVCGTGASCVLGTCVCTAGLIDCSGVCVNVQNDGANCGACGNPCGPGEVCSAGLCSAQG